MKYHCTVVLSGKKKHNKVISYHDLTRNKGPEAKKIVFCWAFIAHKTFEVTQGYMLHPFLLCDHVPSLPIYFHLLDNRIYTKYRNHANQQRTCDEVLNDKLLMFVFFFYWIRR